MQLRYAARSDVGLVRQGNEDSGYAGPSLLVIADGMGGHAAGELASATAVAILAELDATPPADPVTALADAVDRIGNSIVELVQTDTEVEGMGTTVTAIYWLGARVAVVHVGDSRAYLLRDGELSQLTHDHTYVQTLVDAAPRRRPQRTRGDHCSCVHSMVSIQSKPTCPYARLGPAIATCSARTDSPES